MTPPGLRKLLEGADLKLPLRADGVGPFVLSEEGIAYEVRGWGHLTGGGGRRLNDESAKTIQIARGELIAAAVNALPALLAVAEAAEKYHLGEPSVDHLHALLAALAELERAK